MFKFNFSNEEENSETENASKENEILWYQSKEVKIPDNIKDVLQAIPRDQILKVNYGTEITYSCLSPKEAMNLLKENENNEELSDALKADGLHSDLLPGIYEGGLKTWECTKDLVCYFLENVIDCHKLAGKRVLDLGCGSGILGITCLLQGAEVVFQDYNQEVLETMTIPNIFLNCGGLVEDKVKLFSGDWSSFLNIIISEDASKGGLPETYKFDYILTSETIYNPLNYQKIISIFKKLLKINGSAFVAAKLHYFGVGGSLKEFENLLVKDGFDCAVCWKNTDGVAREILKVQAMNKSLKKDNKC